MFTSRTGRWPSIHWPHDAIWTPILPMDGYGAYVTPIMVFVLYPSYKPLCIEVIFCTLEISSKELGFFLSIHLPIDIHVIYLQNKF